ncbi:IncP-type conjugal transfer protein TrbI [Pelagibacterium lentulum]|uniref:Conjugal transfer protein TrbI n=1 Tax=Pelagibacterium lentulum TaxID=2029865 RepID=A0A916W470_9HYPH|nr:IncP-type conjugal transfer protein TrbI [Pelagibacterium lentulum]GGA64409.1 conjugal transfer protein TrbI [Pelagibacterium lentulum]
MSSIDLDGGGEDQPKIRRLNRLPIIAFIVLVVVFLGVVFWGLSQRGLTFREAGPDNSRGQPASDFADELTRGIQPGIIDEPRAPAQPAVQTPPLDTDGQPVITNPFQPQPARANQPQVQQIQTQQRPSESEAEWRARLQREFEESRLREQHRQQMASLQAGPTAANSPMSINLGNIGAAQANQGTGGSNSTSGAGGVPGVQDLYAAAMQAGLAGQGVRPDPNNQAGKDRFFNQEINDLGYLPNQVVPQLSPYELKRGSVIPATLITGINSDLPGRITAKVRQNVYDSATGHQLLIPQGTRLVGRYDSNVSFGQSRVLVIWTDLVFPNGSTLQIGGMPGMDAQGYSGFRDRVDNHYFQIFGSAALIALIGTGIDMAIPQSSTLATQDTASDAARRNFAETFGRVADQTISRNLDVQPTLEIRPGYQFNVFVEQDIIFPGAFNSTWGR